MYKCEAERKYGTLDNRLVFLKSTLSPGYPLCPVYPISPGCPDLSGAPSGPMGPRNPAGPGWPWSPGQIKQFYWELTEFLRWWGPYSCRRIVANLEVPGSLSNPMCLDHPVGCWVHHCLPCLLWFLAAQLVQQHQNLVKIQQYVKLLRFLDEKHTRSQFSQVLEVVTKFDLFLPFYTRKILSTLR